MGVPAWTGRAVQIIPPALKPAACGEGSSSAARDLPESQGSLKLRAVSWSLLMDLTQEVLDGCPSKTKPLLWKTLAGTSQMVNFPFWTLWCTHRSTGVCPQRPREVDKSKNGEGQGCSNLLQTAPCPLSNLSGDSQNCPCLIPSLCD